MAEADIARLRRMADGGNIEAGLILELMDKCQKVAAGHFLDGLTLAFGLRAERDHDEILAGIMEDLLHALLPPILKMTYSGMPGDVFDGLKFAVPIRLRLEVAIFSFYRWNRAWPHTVTLSSRWKSALAGETTYVYRDASGGEHPVALNYVRAGLETLTCAESAQEKKEGKKG
jgi:hypothetical protein